MSQSPVTHLGLLLYHQHAVIIYSGKSKKKKKSVNTVGMVFEKVT